MSISSVSSAGLRLPSVFSSHMVLQRDAPIKVWGWASAGSPVRVTLGGETIDTVTNEDGEWVTELSGRSAGPSLSLAVESGEERIEVSDVCLGDVWIASGQSNMEWKLMWNVNDWEAEAAGADFPEVRFFQVEKRYAQGPRDDVENVGGWRMAHPDTVPEFSAVAWFFAKRNHLEKGVPVGILESSWGGTPAEAWLPVESLAKVSGYEAAAAEVISGAKSSAAFVEENERAAAAHTRILNAVDSAAILKASDGDESAEWRTVDFPSDEVFTDIVWLRRAFDWQGEGEPGRLFLEKPGKFCRAYLNGQYIGEKTWEAEALDLAFPDEILLEGRNVLTLRVYDDWDNTVEVLTGGSMRLEADDKWVAFKGSWQVSNDIEEKVPEVEKLFWTPGFLYNAMIEPLGRFAARGVIWYQGESNVGQGARYGDLFKALITSWREERNQPELAFVFCQLANFLERQENPQESEWAALRAAQAEALELDGTAMAVLIDIGDAKDIHPRNKQDVGTRLWLAARKASFGEDISYSGPEYSNVVLKESSVEVTFEVFGSRIEGGIGDEVMGFQLAGADRVFALAEARVLDGSTLLVKSEDAPSPRWVRYAWADNPECDLRNAGGLPAIPFESRTR